jgi:hypothetical protein
MSPEAAEANVLERIGDKQRIPTAPLALGAE